MIGVCIKYFHENYGGMLQAFATTQIFESRNIPYELIRYEKKKSVAFTIKSVPRLFNQVLFNDKYEALQKKISLKKHPEFAQNNFIRMKAFERFKKTNFTKLSSEYYGLNQLLEGAKNYTAVVTGSDQLWSPAGLPTNFYNLQFVPDEIRKISYASSFGVNNIPYYQIKRTKKFLNRIEFISMRENRGREIVKELIGRNVPILLDPVLMFDSEQWNRMIPVNVLCKQPYIFAYFLGANVEYRKAVIELSKATGCKIVTLRHLDQFVSEDETFGDYAPYDVGPVEFLNYLRNADYVCTDSFHGSVFSIIYRKKFVSFNRYDEASKYSKNSRIDTLCKEFGLEDRRFNGTLIEVMQQNIDYKVVNDKLVLLKAESMNYLDKAFDGVI